MIRRVIDILKYAFKDYKLQCEAKRLYYTDSQFSRIDRALLRPYFFSNPYRIHKKYIQKKQGKNIHTYGETPLSSYEHIAKEADINADDVFLELGFGRGRGMFFLHHFFRCEVIGIERVPFFVQFAQYIAHQYSLKRVSFICSDITDIQLPKASVIYLCGTCFRDEEIQYIASMLRTFQHGTRVISISYPLTEYDDDAFDMQKIFPVKFLWGEADAYLQVVQ